MESYRRDSRVSDNRMRTCRRTNGSYSRSNCSAASESPHRMRSIVAAKPWSAMPDSPLLSLSDFVQTNGNDTLAIPSQDNLPTETVPIREDPRAQIFSKSTALMCVFRFDRHSMVSTEHHLHGCGRKTSKRNSEKQLYLRNENHEKASLSVSGIVGIDGQLVRRYACHGPTAKRVCTEERFKWSQQRTSTVPQPNESAKHWKSVVLERSVRVRYQLLAALAKTVLPSLMVSKTMMSLIVVDSTLSGFFSRITKSASLPASSVPLEASSFSW